MNLLSVFPVSLPSPRRRALPSGGNWIAAFTALLATLLLAACSGGGGGGGGGSSTPVVGTPPIIVAQPQSVRVADGQPASFSVTVASGSTVSYQWSRGGVAIAGATAATYTLAAAQLGDDGATFTVVASNATGTVQSAAATLNVTAVAPSLVNDAPRTVSVVEGQPATFSVTARGSAPLSFQWRRNGAAVPGATSASYTLASTVAADNGAVFDVVVTNPAGSITSAPVTLAVTPIVQAPSIATQPASQTVPAGSPVTFSVVAAGTSPFTYQWFRNGVAIAGAQSSSYTLSTTSLADSGATFTVLVANAAGSVPSAAATLTVTSQSSIASVAGNFGGPGTIDGAGTGARFASPAGVALDNGGNLYVADATMVRRVDASGVVTTFAGSPTATGSADGAGSAALFGVVASVAVDPAGNVFVADSRNQTIRKITPAGVVTTFAGTTGVAGSADGTGTAAQFNLPAGIATDAAGNVYVADTGNQTIRRISPAGVVVTLAGSAGVTGAVDGTGAGASFSGPNGLVVDASGNVFVVEVGNSIVRRVTPTGVVTTFAGVAGAIGSADGVGTAARFNGPSGIAIDGAGNLYVGDGKNGTLRAITPAAVVTTIAGTPGAIGAADGTGAAASFSTYTTVAATAGGTLYVADRDNFEVRTVSTTRVVVTLAGAPQVAGSADGVGSAARFTQPYGVAVDAAGTLYVADPGTSTIRRIASGNNVTTLAGLAGSPGVADGVGPAARFGGVRGIAVGASGNLYVADFSNNTIRMVTPAGAVTTLAGNPLIAGAVDATGSAATFNGPSAVAVDAAGNVFVTDTINSTIRRVTPSGVVTTFAGIAGVRGAADGNGTAATFNLPSGIAIDASGTLYVADTGNATIRRISSSGVVTTVAGSAGRTGSADGAATVASFNGPVGIGVSPAGNLFVVDTNNRTLRKIDTAGNVTTVAGVPDGRRGVRLGTLPGSFSQPLHVAVDAAGNVFVTDANGVLTIATP